MVSSVSESGNAVSDGHEEADLAERPVDSAHEGPSLSGVGAADRGSRRGWEPWTWSGREMGVGYPASIQILALRFAHPAVRYGTAE